MPYFIDQYPQFRWTMVEDAALGFRPAQLAALHTLAAHFIQHRDPAIVTMPTGSGKTAVLMASTFIMHPRRVLVLTPSRLVREQIVDGFKTLDLLRRLRALPADAPAPQVRNVSNRITSLDAWAELSAADVVVGTPSSLSPEIESIPNPPTDLFDLVLIDEAHHSPAVTWNAILTHFQNAKHILFTATPFRHDRKIVKGSFVYTYDMKMAFDDRVFGAIEYSPVTPLAGENPDIAIALATQKTFTEDRQAGLQHIAMVRTGQVSKAEALKVLYETHTNLRLTLVTGQKSLRQVKDALRKLDSGELDGLICVDMLGEGFDMPKLKIAALHTPHRSLAVTLQFIGRFARTTGEHLGRAKFHAIESEIAVEKSLLFAEGAVWQKLIQDLSTGRIRQEQRSQAVLGTFSPSIRPPDDFPDLSLYSLRPYFHVKIFNAGPDLDLSRDIEFGNATHIVYRHNSTDFLTSVYVTRTTTRPRWTTVSHLDTVTYELLILHYDRASGYLFACSSRRDNELYGLLAKTFGPTGGPDLRGVSSFRLNRVLSGLEDPEFYNIGMRSGTIHNKEASYKTIVGSAVDQTLERADGKSYYRGHWFGKAREDGKDVTIGLSVASKVWSNASGLISELIDWCDKLASKIVSGTAPRTGSGLDHLSTGQEVEALPANIFCVDWDKRSYTHPESISIETSNGVGRIQLLDLDIKVDRTASTDEFIVVVFSKDDVEFKATFSFSTNRYIEPLAGDTPPIRMEHGDSGSFVSYLNEHLPIFYTTSFGCLQGNTFYEPPVGNDVTFDPQRLEPKDWQALGVDSHQEVNGSGTGVSIHEWLAIELEQSEAPIVFYDHGSGEIADFLTISFDNDYTRIVLFHCKKSGGTSPGSRVDDLYEVCGQAVKSANWLDGRRLLQSIRYRLESRGGRSRFVKGEMTALTEILQPQVSRAIRLQIVIVQPGLSAAHCTSEVSSLLAAADEFMFGGGRERLRIIASS